MKVWTLEIQWDDKDGDWTDNLMGVYSSADLAKRAADAVLRDVQWNDLDESIGAIDAVNDTGTIKISGKPIRRASIWLWELDEMPQESMLETMADMKLRLGLSEGE